VEHADIVPQADKLYLSIAFPLGKTQNNAENQGKDNDRNKNNKSRKYKKKIAYFF
jgi:hypothetical protein